MAGGGSAPSRRTSTTAGSPWSTEASGGLAVPITVPAGTRTITLSLLGIEIVGGPYGAAYGRQRSAWTTLARNGQQLLRQPR